MLDLSITPQELSPSAQQGDIICFGFLTYCLLLVVKSYPEKNAGEPVLDEVETLGDDAAIIACILKKWLLPVQLVSSTVGNDAYGGSVIKKLKSVGLSNVEQAKTDESYRTPLEVAIVDESGSRTYFQRREPKALATLTPPTIEELTGASMLYVDWYDGSDILVAMERAYSLMVPVFLNLESKYEDTSYLAELLSYAHICQISLDEPGAFADTVDISRRLIDQGVQIVLVTKGSQGCMVAHKNKTYSVEPLPIHVIDGYGAGAAFSAGFIYGIRNEWSVSKSVQFAMAHASLKCSVTGMADFSVDSILELAASLDVQIGFL